MCESCDTLRRFFFSSLVSLTTLTSTGISIPLSAANLSLRDAVVSGCATNLCPQGAAGCMVCVPFHLAHIELFRRLLQCAPFEIDSEIRTDAVSLEDAKTLKKREKREK